MNISAEYRVALTALERFVIGFGVVTVCCLAWVFMASQAGTMADMSGLNGSQYATEWRFVNFVAVYFMWVVMMVAMMVPAASPMVGAFATINRRRRDAGNTYVGTVVFLLGYLFAWSLFSIVATGMHWALEFAGWLTPMMESSSRIVSSVLFGLAGLYQWTQLKDICLTRCRTPTAFILTEWRDGAVGAVIMGLRHGLFCVGCCAALMGLLFAVAVMDLRWVAVVTGLVTIEKLMPWPDLWRNLIGFGLLIAASGFAVGWL